MTFTPFPPQCFECRHLHPYDRKSHEEPLTCDAFPGGIPEDILEAAPHDKPYLGDHGIQFEPRVPSSDSPRSD